MPEEPPTKPGARTQHGRSGRGRHVFAWRAAVVCIVKCENDVGDRSSDEMKLKDDVMML